MGLTAGVREFRQDLAGYIDQAEPVTITRHGQAVGLFIPVRPDRQAAADAYAAAAKKANDLLAEMDLDEDEIVTEFDARRKAKRNTGSAP